MLRILPGIAALLLTLMIFAAGFAGWTAYALWTGSGPESGPAADEVRVEIPKGATLAGVADDLKSKGVIANRDLFYWGGRLQGFDTQIKAGQYEIPVGANMPEIYARLIAGDVVQEFITVREGLTSWEIVQNLNADPRLEGAALTDIPPEGRLLPETYSFTSGDTREDLVGRMRAAMDRTLEDLWAGRAQGLPVGTPEEALILASLIEKETGTPEERRAVAGVFVNRLRKGMALQTDPTVIYALTSGRPESEGQGPLGRRLLRKDLEIDSPYNTYKYPGLPPGPIANPGRASIAAALNPEQHDFLYFVADGTGGHVFSKTLAEHNRNAARWRKIRAGQAKKPDASVSSP